MKIKRTHIILACSLIFLLVFQSCNEQQKINQTVESYIHAKFKNSKVLDIIVNEGDGKNVYVDVTIVDEFGKKTLSLLLHKTQKWEIIQGNR